MNVNRKLAVATAVFAFVGTAIVTYVARSRQMEEIHRQLDEQLSEQDIETHNVYFGHLGVLKETYNDGRNVDNEITFYEVHRIFKEMKEDLGDDAVNRLLVQSHTNDEVLAELMAVIDHERKPS